MIRDGWEEEIQKSLDKKIIWPFPDENLKKQPGNQPLSEYEKELEKKKKELCAKAKFQQWKTTLISENRKQWELWNGNDYIFRLRLPIYTPCCTEVTFM